MLGDGVRDALRFVSGESGAQQVVGVGGVAVGAGGADRGAPVPARGEDGAGAFEQDGAVAVEDLRGAGEVDGGGAAAGGLDLGAPCAVAGGAEPVARADRSTGPLVDAGWVLVMGMAFGSCWSSGEASEAAGDVEDVAAVSGGGEHVGGALLVRAVAVLAGIDGHEVVGSGRVRGRAG